MGTQADNLADAARKGRMGKKLQPEDAIEIKRLLAANVARKEIAEMFDVRVQTIGHIARGQTWQHVEVSTVLPRAKDEELAIST